MTGQEIKDVRLKLGLSQSKFAEAIGTTKHRVSDWENNKHKATRPFLMLIEILKDKTPES
jgi:DNA-binding transcriptional regulator YiaG